MECGRHRLEVDDPGCALEGMKRPENAVDATAILGVSLEGKEIVGARDDQLARFDEKLLQELVH